jgi:hypothetical protein
MGKGFLTIAAVIAFALPACCQSAQRALLHAGSCFYKHTIYVYGYEQRKEQLVFRCLSYNSKLALKDSAEFALGKHNESQYLDISRDTLHDVLNFYFQLADQKNKVSLCRLDSNLKILCTATDFDANHVNSIAAFEDESYRYRQSMYVISTAEDSTGKQFYLSRYDVKAMNTPFEYDSKWQYAFERKHIQRATVIAADSIQVVIYAHVTEGLKKGQWILRVNARSGTLIKGTKLNPKGDERHYLYSKAMYHAKDRSLDLAGSIYPSAMIDFQKATADFKTLSATHQLFVLHIDSLGEVTSRFEKLLPLPAATSKPGTGATLLHFRIREFGKQGDKGLMMWADLYEQKQANVMTYYSSWQVKLSATEEGYSIKTSTVYPLPKLVPDLIGTTPGNTYGKIYLNSMAGYDKFAYTHASNPVVVNSSMDANDFPILILKKVNILNGQKSYLEVLSGKKGAEVKALFNTAKNQASDVFIFGNGYVSFLSDAGNTGYTLKVNTL